MIENISPIISLVFVLVTVITVAFYVLALSKTSSKIVSMIAAALIALMVVHAFLAYSGFYTLRTIPPRFFLGFLPTTVVLLILLTYWGRNGVSFNSMRLLTLLSIVRIPIEMILYWVYQEGSIPQVMTFEGRNLDLISGISAPLFAWLAFRGGKINRPLLIGWNVLGLALLVNILTVAILSLETPFQRFAFDQPNRGVLYFPFIWLPAIIVPIFLATHIFSLRELLKRPLLHADVITNNDLIKEKRIWDS